MLTLAQLQAKFAALPAGRDIPNTPRAQEEAWERREVLTKRITLARNASDNIAEVEPRLVDLTKWADFLVDSRKTISEQLLASGPARDRATMDQLTGLRLSIAAIDRNLDWQNEALPLRTPILEMMKAAGYDVWLGCLPATAQRIADLQKRLDVAKQDLEAALRDPV